MIEAYKKFFKNYANFRGVATREEYWWVILANFLIGFVLGLIGGMLPAIAGATSAIAGLYSLVVFIPGLSIFVRRLHDTDRSGWNWLWCLLPFAGAIVLLVFLCLPSVNENNKYKVSENM